MNSNPYILERDLPIFFNGHVESEGTYAYRVALREANGLEPLLFEMKLSQWLFDNLGMPNEDWFMGNDVAHLNLHNENDGDTFIRIRSVADAIQFEDAFKITGIALDHLVP